mgnify:CR=1 FL=1
MEIPKQTVVKLLSNTNDNEQSLTVQSAFYSLTKGRVVLKSPVPNRVVALWVSAAAGVLTALSVEVLVTDLRFSVVCEDRRR